MLFCSVITELDTWIMQRQRNDDPYLTVERPGPWSCLDISIKKNQLKIGKIGKIPIKNTNDGLLKDENIGKMEKWWVRPNLNRSHLHPKQEGFQATPRTRL